MGDHRVLPDRRTVRLPQFDYSSTGAYFITLVTAERRCNLSIIQNSEPQLLPLGRILVECWLEIPTHFAGCNLDLSVTMPNHFHGILWLRKDLKQWQPNGNFGTRQGSLSSIVQALKAAASRRANLELDAQGPWWQRGFHEHVIRDDDDLYLHRQYILDNPRAWELDRENPNHIKR
jgi:putative transposase